MPVTAGEIEALGPLTFSQLAPFPEPAGGGEWYTSPQVLSSAHFLNQVCACWEASIYEHEREREGAQVLPRPGEASVLAYRISCVREVAIELLHTGLAPTGRGFLTEGMQTNWYTDLNGKRPAKKYPFVTLLMASGASSAHSFVQNVVGRMQGAAHSVEHFDRELYWGWKLWPEANPWQRGHTLLRARSYFVRFLDPSRAQQGVVKRESPEIKEEEASLSKFSPRSRRVGRSNRVWE